MDTVKNAFINAFQEALVVHAPCTPFPIHHHHQIHPLPQTFSLPLIILGTSAARTRIYQSDHTMIISRASIDTRLKTVA